MATIDRRGVLVDATDTAIVGDPNPGLAIKAPCLVATTANIVLSGLQTIDGVAVGNAGERVLVWQQADPTTNGIYNAASGVWTRTIDARSNDQIASGMQVVVSKGASQAGNEFYLTTADPAEIGISPLQFANLIAANSGSITFIQAGAGAVSYGMRDKVRQILSVRDFGAKGDGGTDDFAAIMRAHNAAIVSTDSVYWPPGTYKSSQTLPLGSSNMRHFNFGGVTIKHAGSGPAVTFDGSAGELADISFGARECPFRIVGNAGTTHAVYASFIEQSSINIIARDFTGAGLYIFGGVSCDFFVKVSTNDGGAFLVQPVAGVSSDNSTTACNFHVIAEGISGTGVGMVNTSYCTFRGTSEGNIAGGGGVYEGPGCIGNVFDNFDCESNAGIDWLLGGGQQTILNSCNGSSASGGLSIQSGGRIQIRGGVFRNISVDSASANCYLEYAQYLGTFTNSSTTTSWRRVYNGSNVFIADHLIPASIIYADIQNVASGRLLGNVTGSPAAIQEVPYGATFIISAGALQTAAITGDITAAANSFVTTLANIPSGVPVAGSLLHANIAAPSTPAAGKVSVWTDSTDQRLHDKNAAGTVGTTVVADAGASHNFITAISAAGVISKAQPAFTDISGSVAAAQMPAFTGDVTTSAGAVATTIQPAAVTYAKIQNVGSARLLGNVTGSPAAVQEIPYGATFAISGGALQTAAITGDITTSANSFVTTLATVNANVGSFGSSTAIPSFNVNGKGLITSASTSAVIAPAGTLTGTTLASNVVTSSLTQLGSIVTAGTGAAPAGWIANGSNSGTGGGSAITAELNGTASVGFGNYSKVITGGAFDPTPVIYVNAQAKFYCGGDAMLWGPVTASSSVGTGTLVLLGSGGLGVGGAGYFGAEIATGVTTVASLPAAGAPRKGARHFVTDANVTTTAGIGAVVAGGGANNVPVYCDGTNWRIG